MKKYVKEDCVSNITIIDNGLIKDDCLPQIEVNNEDSMDFLQAQDQSLTLNLNEKPKEGFSSLNSTETAVIKTSHQTL